MQDFQRQAGTENKKMMDDMKDGLDVVRPPKKLNEYSKWLANFQPGKYDDIEIPGQCPVTLELFIYYMVK